MYEKSCTQIDYSKNTNKVTFKLYKGSHRPLNAWQSHPNY